MFKADELSGPPTGQTNPWLSAADIIDPPKEERDIWKADPVSWVRNQLGEFLWSKQREIIESVRDHRRTVVRSCHTIGKSWIAARIAAWWIVSHKPGEARVVTSAPTNRQVRAILWHEINRAHTAGNLPGRTNQTEWFLRMTSGKEEMVAFGQKPAGLDPSAFQGIHAPFVLVIFDEACGIPRPLWEAADSLISNAESRFLAIGNPDDPLTEFGDVSKPGSGWNPIKVSFFDTPNATGEAVPPDIARQLCSPVWQEEKKRKWGEDNPMYISKVLGEFPITTTGGLIPMQWITAAQANELPWDGEPNELGVDVGAGGDESTIAHRRGGRVRITQSNKNPDTMQTLGLLMSELERTGAAVAKIDDVGIGRGVKDRAKEVSNDQSTVPPTRERARLIRGINVGTAANDSETYVNLRAEAYWGLRERFQEGDIDIDPSDEDLAAELIDLRFKRTSRGQIQIESKDDMRKRGKPSPNRADAVMLSFLRDSKKKKKGRRLVWGRKRA